MATKKAQAEAALVKKAYRTQKAAMPKTVPRPDASKAIPPAPRPSKGKYSPEVFDEIVARISAGETLASALSEDRMPTRMIFHEWLGKSDDHDKRYARARAIGFDAIADQAFHIADTPIDAIKTVESADGFTTTREDATAHRRLQIDTRLRLLACWSPSRYGNKTVISGDADNPVLVTQKLVADAGELIAAMQNRKS